MPSRTRLCPRECEAKRHFRTQWRRISCLPDCFESCEHIYIASMIYIAWKWHCVTLYYRRCCRIAKFTLKLSHVCRCYEHLATFLHSSMIILDDQARQQMTSNYHFNATFCPSWASSGIHQRKRNKHFELKNSWGIDGAPQTRTTC